MRNQAQERQGGSREPALHPHSPRELTWSSPGSPLMIEVSDLRRTLDSLCGKSSALKTFRQKCAPRRATPVGLSRLPSMSSLSSEGSFLSSYNANKYDF